MTYFWLLLLAHVIADFVLQTDAISGEKCRNNWRGYTYHGLGVFICTLLAIHLFGWWNALLAAVLVTLIHLVLDWVKNYGRWVISRITKKDLTPGVVGLLLDQTLHIFSLLWVWYLLDKPVNTAVTAFYQNALAPVQPLTTQFQLENAIPVLAIGMLVAFGGAVLVRMALDQIFNPGQFRGQTPAGKYIGILERLLILTLTATGNIAGVGFVFTAKSIARFNEIADNRQFAEYYLVGTLVSFFVALMGGMVVSYWL